METAKQVQLTTSYYVESGNRKYEDWCAHCELKEEMAMKRFSDGLLGLKCFLKKSGHLLVPKFYSENPTFGLCVEEMRIEYRKIFKGMKEGGDAFSAGMTAEVVKELSELGFLAEEGLTLQAHTTITESEAIENEVALNNL